MTLLAALGEARRVLVDSAPVIYYVEAHPLYLPVVEPFFGQLDSGLLTAVFSPVTITECLVGPIRDNKQAAAATFEHILTTGPGVEIRPLVRGSAIMAARLRAELNLRLADALLAATALDGDCDAVLTNDAVFRRVPGLRVVCVDECLP